jgi:hypothetical protein
MHFGLLALYGGPDQVMTVTSGIAGIIGVLLVFWHKVVNLFFRIIGRKPSTVESSQQAGSAQDSSKTPSQAE